MSDIKKNANLPTKDPREIFIREFPSKALIELSKGINSTIYSWLTLPSPVMDVDISIELEGVTEISAEFWLNSQLAYDLHKIATRNSEK